MQTELILSGFGGQGILFAGRIISHAAVDKGKQVTWIPSYGPEMRGGTVNCTVVIADDEIASPFVKNPDAALVTNLPSLDKFELMVRPGGLLVINKSMVNREVLRTDVKVLKVPCNEIAKQVGRTRLETMAAVGALVTGLRVLSVADLEGALNTHMPSRHKHLLDENVEALKKGSEFAWREFGSSLSLNVARKRIKRMGTF
jgi:2-oxoglutarate ferredoxin oxidoreductase subunit gamma